MKRTFHVSVEDSTLIVVMLVCPQTSDIGCPYVVEVLQPAKELKHVAFDLRFRHANVWIVEQA